MGIRYAVGHRCVIASVSFIQPTLPSTEYDLNDNTVRAMDVVTNTFCAGGALLGDGNWINVGGNQEVTYGGLSVNDTSQDLYKDGDGRFAVR